MLCEEYSDIDLNNIIIMEPIKNNVLLESYFYKINYYNNIIIYNGLYIHFELKYLELYNDKITYNIDENLNIFNKLFQIENNILNIINIQKKKNLKIKDIIEKKYIKYNNIDINSSININNINTFKNISKKNNNIELILKISGIWKTNENYGLTFKFLICNKFLSIC